MVALWPCVAVAFAADHGVVKLRNPEPFTTWAASAAVETPPFDVESIDCPGSDGHPGICVKPDTQIMYFPAKHFDLLRARVGFWHEVGHEFQLAHNAEVQAGWPAVDAGCNGTFSFNCAERFADAYRNCAANDKDADERDPWQFNRTYMPTATEHAIACSFINNVAE